MAIINEVIEDLLLHYSLKKIPSEDSLYDCLAAYAKPNLIRLAQKNGIDIKKSWNQ